MFSQSQTRNCTPISALEHQSYLPGIVQRAVGVSENKMDLPHLCTCLIVCGSEYFHVLCAYMCFGNHFVFFIAVYCGPFICSWGVWRVLLLHFLFCLCACVCVCVHACVCLIWCDCAWHVVCAGAVNRRDPNCDSSALFSPVPWTFHPSEGLSIGRCVCIWINKCSDAHAHAHAPIGLDTYTYTHSKSSEPWKRKFHVENVFIETICVWKIEE